MSDFLCGRRNFLGGMAALTAAPCLVPANAAEASKVASFPLRFFADEALDFVYRLTLGRAAYQCGDIGRILWIMAQNSKGDYASAWRLFKQAGDQAKKAAEEAVSNNIYRGAATAALAACSYYDAAAYLVDPDGHSELFAPFWWNMRKAWELFVEHSGLKVSHVKIPYEQTSLPGMFIQSHSGKGPVVIFNNGSDGSPIDMWAMGAKDALERGWHVLIFDGPGQGLALMEQKLYFRPDWEKVITPVVDFLLTLPQTDPERIALTGVSQAGYWVPRALAYEQRICAGVADPGVTDVSVSWKAHIPAELIQLLDSGQDQAFEEAMRQALKDVPVSVSGGLRFRMRPFGTDSYAKAYKAAGEYRLTADIMSRVKCPILITSPDKEQFWPDQSEQLQAGLTACSAEILRFTEAEGADWHCEPLAFPLRNQRIMDWLHKVF